MKDKSKKRKIISLVFLILTVCFSILLFMLSRQLPGVAAKVIEKHLDSFKSLDFKYEDVSVKLFRKVKISGITVTSKETHKQLCSIDSISASISPLKMFSDKVPVSSVTIYGPSCVATFICEDECRFSYPIKDMLSTKSNSNRLPSKISLEGGRLTLNTIISGVPREFSFDSISSDLSLKNNRDASGSLEIKTIENNTLGVSSLRSRFKYSGGIISLDGLEWKPDNGTAKIIGTIDMNSGPRPFMLDAKLSSIPIASLYGIFRNPDGLADGVLDGTLHANGEIANPFQTDWSLKLESADAMLALPLKYEDSDLEDKDKLLLKDLKVNIDAKGSGGDILVDAAAFNSRSEIRLEKSEFSLDDFIDGKDNPGLGIDAVFTVTIESIKDITDGMTGFDIPFDGVMSVHAAVAGSTAPGAGYAADGFVRFTDGVLYQTPRKDKASREKMKIDYDVMNMGFRYKKNTLRIDEMTISSNDIDFAAEGYVRMGGKIDIKGQADMSADMADRLFSWKYLAELTDGDTSLDRITADFYAAGSTRLPVVYWDPAHHNLDVPDLEAWLSGKDSISIEDKNLVEKIGAIIDQALQPQETPSSASDATID